MTRVVAVANQKGGVGKTTTSVNLSASLAMSGSKVLLIDLDPQGNATMGCGVDKNAVPTTIYDWLVEDRPLQEIVSHCQGGFDVLPANLDLTAAEVALVNAKNEVWFDSPLRRYEVVLTIKRAASMRSSSPEDSLSLLHLARSQAEESIERFPNIMYSYFTFDRVAFEYYDYTKKRDWLKESANMMERSYERLLDPEILKRLNRTRSML